MGDGDEPVIALHPQHKIGEGEVRNHLPVDDEQVQPIDFDW